jgi:hypothetical protein
MPQANQVSYIDRDGERQEIEVKLEDYKAAEDAGLTLPQYMNQKYPTVHEDRNGSTFSQMMASCGLLMAEDRNFGLRPPTIKDIMDGKAGINMAATIERPDGSQSQTPAGRIFFPAVLLDLLESSLRDDRTTYNSTFMQMVAFTRTITSPIYSQVIIDRSKPRGYRSMPISQMAEPVRMLSITTSQVQRAIPVWSIGLEISKEAQAASTLDLVGIAIREQALEELSHRLDEDFAGIVNGSVDSGETGVITNAVTAASFDSSIAAAGTLTQKAWVKWLLTGRRKRTIDWAVCDVDTYFAITSRTGRPVQNETSAPANADERLNTIPRFALPGIPGFINIFVTEDATFGTNTIVGLDSSKAMRRIVYVGADYQAIEEYVMRKSTAMRMDYSERIESAGYPEAFSVLTLTV